MRSAISLDRRQFTTGLLGLAASAAVPVAKPLAAAPLTAPDRPIARKFKVFWKGDAIGTHAFSIVPSGRPGDWDVIVDIDFLIDLGWFGEITYRHTSRETWRGGRLASLEGRTDDDGDVSNVTGAAAGDYFRMQGPNGAFETPGNVLTSNSAWSEQVCRERQIIDATAGTLVGLVASLDGIGYAFALGQQHPARIYQLISPIVAGSFWYDDAGIWIKGLLQRRGQEIEYILAA